ncbi:hypothetical protein DPMN_158146 [Dreissena polymorpha]|uniref:Uncharacterized protein n=1 Tax=Dreissena polymorpha TaxID=45954 RepID=A0A9D4IQN0_DREPO|nr:hypothetical protein DPMN_158146 [Dreissena polymorpha]
MAHIALISNRESSSTLPLAKPIVSTFTGSFFNASVGKARGSQWSVATDSTHHTCMPSPIEPHFERRPETPARLPGLKGRVGEGTEPNESSIKHYPREGSQER